MSIRNWITVSAVVTAIAFAVAFAGGAWLLSNYKQYQAEQRQDASRYSGQAAEQIKNDPCVRMGGIVDGVRCFLQEAHAQREDQRAKYHLEAQQDMAAWTLGMLVISFVGLIATIFGAVLLSLSLVYSARATKAAADAAIAADRTLNRTGPG